MNKLISAVDKHKQLILDTERYIWKNPETGYKEFKTSKYLKEIFESLGYELTMAENITGFCTVIDTGRPGPEILILGEMDSIICPTHPEADPETGAVHSCGHNAQCAALVGVAAALKEEGALDGLCGRIKLCAVPAEELLEIEYRNSLKSQGIISYMGGKSEFMSRGFFDTTDIAFMVHTTMGENFKVRNGSVGCIAKSITYKGKASHAGGAPWNGINVLYAANCGLNAVNAIRETFKEDDIIRVHPIVTSGGSMVNAIPETATLESYIRGKTFEAMKEANRKVNRALCGAALSLGANIDITDISGYAPLNNDPNMMKLVGEAVEKALPEYEFEYCDVFNSGSTDMGDLSCIMPVVHPYAPGAEGNSHGNNYYIVNPVSACVDCAKMQLAMLHMLLSDNAERAKKIKAEFKPMFNSPKEYLDYVDKINASGDRIIYGEDGIAKVNIK